MGVQNRLAFPALLDPVLMNPIDLTVVDRRRRRKSENKFFSVMESLALGGVIVHVSMYSSILK